MYYYFIVLYVLLLLYCAFVALRLLLARAVDKHLFPAHLQVGMVSVLRILSCLRFLLGSNPWFLAVVSALPYPLEFWLFMRLAASWIVVVHYAFMGEARSWQKIRPVFWALFGFGSSAAVVLFVVFAIEASLTAAIAGTAVLSTCYLLLAIAFQLYAYILSKELGTLSTNRKITESATRGVAVHIKIKWTGRVVACSFVFQATANVLALVSPATSLDLWTALYLAFNVLALTCLLVLYFEGVRKAIAKNHEARVELAHTSQNSPSRHAIHRVDSDVQSQN